MCVLFGEGIRKLQHVDRWSDSSRRTERCGKGAEQPTDIGVAGRPSSEGRKLRQSFSTL